MVRLVRLLAGVTVSAATLGLATAGPAAACSCSGDIDDAASFEQADAVFVATPLRFRDARDGGSGFAVTVMRVSDVYKGEVTAEQAVATSDLSSCGFHFEADTAYIVFARATSEVGELEDGVVYAESCTGTRAIADEAIELGVAPSPPQPGTVDEAVIAAQLGNPRSSLFPEAFIFVGVLGFVLAMIFWLNRESRVAS